MILVTTAGKVGAEAARLLSASGTCPSGCWCGTRTRRRPRLAEPGGDRRGDLDVPASIDAAMAGVTRGGAGQPGRARPGTERRRQRRPGRRRARRQGDQQGLGRLADRPAARADRDRGRPGRLRDPAHAAAVQRLHAERPRAGPGDRHDQQLRLRAGKGRTGLVDARDVAAVAAEIAASPAPHAGKTYWLTGPELLSNYDVAAVLSKLLGRTITYRELTFEQNKDAMIRAGVPEQIAEMNAQAFSLTADGDAEWVTEDVPSLLGRPARSFEQFAADYAAAFSYRTKGLFPCHSSRILVPGRAKTQPATPGCLAAPRDQAARDQAARDQAARDQAARDQAARGPGGTGPGGLSTRCPAVTTRESILALLDGQVQLRGEPAARPAQPVSGARWASVRSWRAEAGIVPTRSPCR
jgi:uncharacterized protein YbjT (DUF2867 family)